MVLGKGFTATVKVNSNDIQRTSLALSLSLQYFILAHQPDQFSVLSLTVTIILCIDYFQIVTYLALYGYIIFVVYWNDIVQHGVVVAISDWLEVTEQDRKDYVGAIAGNPSINTRGKIRSFFAKIVNADVWLSSLNTCSDSTTAWKVLKYGICSDLHFSIFVLKIEIYSVKSPYSVRI